MDKLRLDFANWSVKDYEAFTLASLTGDAVTVADKLSKLILAWDIEDATPTDPASYGKLSLRNIGRVLKAVSDTATKMLYEGEVIAGFEFDVTGWNFTEFTDYARAVSNNDIVTMYALLSKVLIEWPFSVKFDVEGLSNLNYEQYCQLNNAVKRVVTEALQGN